MYRITGHYPVVHRPVVFREAEQQLAHEPWERWLVGGDVRSGRSDDAVAVNGDSLYRFGQVKRRHERGAVPGRHTRTVPSWPPLMITGAVRQLVRAVPLSP